ncbi:Oidioi.mRNA.OKI2018_I69.PAR.g9243.t1.cds [Oikopleura dioica]|uniref:Oidioi.mRNA.OKI2018_I69.PAR.g9243.t1.cds n=1 Tax=Oikopleura dioica TaxID=34765 RepID=A0ABN7RP48_OIKDI|nr:Oidioi.mRNA.OKI2018_I69.PAR.g9243.t1.cds [Oikopleura dioica]
MEPNFDLEEITLTGKALRAIMQKTAQFGVNNYLSLNKDCHERWNYHNAFFFAGTLASTIGYGNIAPETKYGKIFCLAFISFGIPYFAYMMSAISDLINHQMDRIRDWLEKHVFPDGVNYYFIPSCYTFGGLIFFIAIPSYIFTIMEDWTMLDAIYYSFISLSTIGFGDFIPSMEPPNKYAEYVRNDTA